MFDLCLSVWILLPVLFKSPAKRKTTVDIRISSPQNENSMNLLSVINVINVPPDLNLVLKSVYVSSLLNNLNLVIISSQIFFASENIQLPNERTLW